MRRVLTGSILIAIISAALLVSTASGQAVDKEGKTWLESCPDAPALSVTGIWKDPKWGNLTLNQHQDSRVVVGSGDGWDISGVVSGKSVCLLFSHNGKIQYSAVLKADGDSELSGDYVKGLLIGKSKSTNPMRLMKVK